MIRSLVVAAMLAGCGGSAATTTPIQATPPDTSVDVVYYLDGTATGADLTYTDGSGNIQQQTGVGVPMVRESDGEPGMRVTAQRGAFVQFSAQNTGDSGDLNCSIEADGRVINTGHSSGGYAIVSCSATLP